MMKKVISGSIVLSFLFSYGVPVRAGDYPASYLGPGYRDYLNGAVKIRQGFSLKQFTTSENRKQKAIETLNQIKSIVFGSGQAGIGTRNEISDLNFQKLENSRILGWNIEQSIKRIEKNATAEGEFKYIKHTDGKFVYSTDGLPTTIDKEPLIDEFGNLSLRKTYNMFYNKRRLLTSYQAASTDNLGNTTHIFCYGITYDPDAIFYADDETNANKNKMEEYIRKEDSAGNVTLIHWEALSYDGKFLRAFNQSIEDSVYGIQTFTRSNITYNNNDLRQISSYSEQGVGTNGLSYSLTRSNITYNGKDAVMSYFEEKDTTQLDGTNIKTITDAQFSYLPAADEFGPDVEEPSPDRLSTSVFTITTINADGSTRTETTATEYKYGAAQQLTAASGYSEFTGREASWWEYTDSQGRTVARTTNEQGETIYLYIGEGVSEEVSNVTATLKEGHRYTGTSEIQYEILYGKPMDKQTNSRTLRYGREISDDELAAVETSTITYTNGLVNNLRRVLTIQNQTNLTAMLADLEGNPETHIKDILTTNVYAENGNLIDALKSGTGYGYELTNDGWMEYTSEIEADLSVYLGEAQEESYKELKSYYLNLGR